MYSPYMLTDMTVFATNCIVRSYHSHTHKCAIRQGLQSFSMGVDPVPSFNLHTRDCTGREMSMCASTEFSNTRGVSFVNETTSGGTTAGTTERDKGRIKTEDTLTVLTNVWVWSHPQGSNTLSSVHGIPPHLQWRWSVSDFLVVIRQC